MAQTGMTANWTTIRNTALPNADPAAIYQAMPIAPPARNPALDHRLRPSQSAPHSDRTKFQKIKICSAIDFLTH